MKEQKGITLIALIITIIVMLILVGVSVSIALNTGLFKTAQGAAKNTEKARDEEMQLAEGEVKFGDITYSSLTEYTDVLTGKVNPTHTITFEGKTIIIDAAKTTLRDVVNQFDSITIGEMAGYPVLMYYENYIYTYNVNDGNCNGPLLYGEKGLDECNLSQYILAIESGDDNEKLDTNDTIIFEAELYIAPGDTVVEIAATPTYSFEFGGYTYKIDNNTTWAAFVRNCQTEGVTITEDNLIKYNGETLCYIEDYFWNGGSSIETSSPIVGGTILPSSKIVESTYQPTTGTRFFSSEVPPAESWTPIDTTGKLTIELTAIQ